MAASVLGCADCGAQFEFSDDERIRFESLGYAPPKRCKACRDAKRKRQGAPGRASAAPRQAAPARPRGPATTYPATCTICGAATEVPFVPDGRRPIYCLPCLKQRTR